MSARLLHLQDLTKKFEGLTAIDSCSMEVTRGTIHALIGPNGAGKTTLFNMITGVLAPTAGRILFEDTEIQGRQPHAIHRLGIARTFQLVSLFGRMSILENVMVGLHARTRTGVLAAALRTRAARAEEEQTRRRAQELLDLLMPGLDSATRERPAGWLPYGQQRLLEIARALASSPRLVLLDEPGAGMNAEEKERLKDTIYRVRDSGITVFFIEHDMKLAMAVADRVTVLDHGEKIAEGTVEHVQSHPRVLEAYLGGED